MIDDAVRGYASGLGMASGVLGGLIAITPAAGYVTPLAALAFGVLGAVAGYLGVVMLKRLLGVDDLPDVSGAHGVAGAAGSVAVGVFATTQFKASFGVEALATGIIAVYAFVVTLALVAALRAIGTWRVALDEELRGLDVATR